MPVTMILMLIPMIVKSNETLTKIARSILTCTKKHSLYSECFFVVSPWMLFNVILENYVMI